MTNTDYLRQISEKGLKHLGYLLNGLHYLNYETDPEKIQHKLALYSIELERILTEEIISIELENK